MFTNGFNIQRIYTSGMAAISMRHDAYMLTTYSESCACCSCYSRVFVIKFAIYIYFILADFLFDLPWRMGRQEPGTKAGKILNLLLCHVKRNEPNLYLLVNCEFKYIC